MLQRSRLLRLCKSCCRLTAMQTHLTARLVTEECRQVSVARYYARSCETQHHHHHRQPLTTCLQFQLVKCVPALNKPGRMTHWQSLAPLTPRTDYYKYSFLPRTIVDWNSLSFYELSRRLNHSVQHLTVSTSSHWAEPQHSSNNGPRP